MTIDRRTLIGGMAALALPLPAVARGRDTLGGIAAAKGIRFGSTMGHKNFYDPAYRALNARECALVVPETEMKRFGYVVHPLTHTDIQYKAKCKNCNQCAYMMRYRTSIPWALLTP